MHRFRKNADFSNKNEDFESIKQEIYNRHIIVCDKNEFNLNFILSELHDKRRIDCPQKGDTTIVYEGYSYVENNSSVPLELNTIPFAKNFTGTNIVSINKTAGFKVNVDNQIAISFASFKLPIEENFGENNTQIKQIEKSTIVQLAPQKVEVDPFSKLKVSHLVYKYENINTFSIDFELDENSSISCTSIFNGNNTEHDKTFLRDYFINKNEDNQVIRYGNKGLVFEQSEEKFIIRNFTATETIVSFGIRAKYGPAEKL